LKTEHHKILIAKEAQRRCAQASATFNGELNNYIDNVRKQHEQIIDSVNIDAITGWDTNSVDKAQVIVTDFSEY
jgi:type I restriction enzyme R subunit